MHPCREISSPAYTPETETSPAELYCWLFRRIYRESLLLSWEQASEQTSGARPLELVDSCACIHRTDWKNRRWRSSARESSRRRGRALEIFRGAESSHQLARTRGASVRHLGRSSSSCRSLPEIVSSHDDHSKIRSRVERDRTCGGETMPKCIASCIVMPHPAIS